MVAQAEKYPPMGANYVWPLDKTMVFSWMKIFTPEILNIARIELKNS
jgi:hypothetical protein